MERKIGEVFEYNGVSLKVVKQKLNKASCNGCYFDGALCEIDDEITGTCLYRNRRDKANIIFKKQRK